MGRGIEVPRPAPGMSWYLGINKLRVVGDLKHHPDIIKSLGSHYGRFVKWAAVERFTFEENIVEEYRDFKKQMVDTRLYTQDINEWKKISKIVFERDSYTCRYCSQIGNLLEVDHIVPLSKGGNNDLENLTTSCRKCNRQKKDKTVDEFMTWRVANGQRQGCLLLQSRL